MVTDDDQRDSVIPSCISVSEYMCDTVMDVINTPNYLSKFIDMSYNF